MTSWIDTTVFLSVCLFLQSEPNKHMNVILKCVKKRSLCYETPEVESEKKKNTSENVREISAHDEQH